MFLSVQRTSLQMQTERLQSYLFDHSHHLCHQHDAGGFRGVVDTPEVKRNTPLEQHSNTSVNKYQGKV